MSHGTLTGQAPPASGAPRMARCRSAAQDPSWDCFARWEDDGGRALDWLHRTLVCQSAPAREGLTQPVP